MSRQESQSEPKRTKQADERIQNPFTGNGRSSLAFSRHYGLRNPALLGPIIFPNENLFPLQSIMDVKSVRDMRYEETLEALEEEINLIIQANAANIESVANDQKPLAILSASNILFTSLITSLQNLVGTELLVEAEQEDQSWESLLKFHFHQKYHRCASINNYENITKFFFALYKAVYYSCLDEQAQKYNQDIIADNFAKIKLTADLQACAGGSITALETITQVAKSGSSFWHEAQEILSQELLPLSLPGNNAHIPSILRFLLTSDLGNDELLFAASSDMTMEDLRKLIELVTIRSGNLATNILTQNIAKFIQNVERETLATITNFETEINDDEAIAKKSELQDQLNKLIAQKYESLTPQQKAISGSLEKYKKSAIKNPFAFKEQIADELMVQKYESLGDQEKETYGSPEKYKEFLNENPKILKEQILDNPIFQAINEAAFDHFVQDEYEKPENRNKAPSWEIHKIQLLQSPDEYRTEIVESELWNETFWPIFEKQKNLPFQLPSIKNSEPGNFATLFALEDKTEIPKAAKESAQNMIALQDRAMFDEEIEAQINIIILFNSYAAKNTPIPIWLCNKAAEIFRIASVEFENDEEQNDEIKNRIVIEMESAAEKISARFNMPLKLLKTKDPETKEIKIRFHNHFHQSQEERSYTAQSLINSGSSLREITAIFEQQITNGTRNFGTINLFGLLFHPQQEEIIEYLEHQITLLTNDPDLGYVIDLDIDNTISRALIWGDVNFLGLNSHKFLPNTLDPDLSLVDRWFPMDEFQCFAPRMTFAHFNLLFQTLKVNLSKENLERAIIFMLNRNYQLIVTENEDLFASSLFTYLLNACQSKSEFMSWIKDNDLIDIFLAIMAIPPGMEERGAEQESNAQNFAENIFQDQKALNILNEIYGTLNPAQRLQLSSLNWHLYTKFPEDLDLQLQYLIRSAIDGNPEKQKIIGKIYLDKSGSNERREKRAEYISNAARWLQASYNQEPDYEVALELGLIFWEHDLVIQNPNAAAEYFTTALRMANQLIEAEEMPQDYRDEIAEIMPQIAERLQEAEAAAREARTAAATANAAANPEAAAAAASPAARSPLQPPPQGPQNLP